MNLISTTCVLFIFLNEVNSGWSFRITPRDVQTSVEQSKNEILKKLRFLEYSSLNQTKPEHREIMRKMESYRGEALVLYQSILNHSLEMCRGKDASVGDDSRCLKNPSEYVDSNFSGLKTAVNDFVAQTFIDLNKEITAEDSSSSENLSSQEGLSNGGKRARTKSSSNSLYLRYLQMFGKLWGIKDNDVRENYMMMLVAFEFEWDAVHNESHDSAIKKCTKGKSKRRNWNNDLCVRQCVSEYIGRRYKPIVEKLEKFEEEIIHKDIGAKKAEVQQS